MASQPIFQFYAVLNDYKPKILRRFQAVGNITMARLWYIIITTDDSGYIHKLFSGQKDGGFLCKRKS